MQWQLAHRNRQSPITMGTHWRMQHKIRRAANRGWICQCSALFQATVAKFRSHDASLARRELEGDTIHLCCSILNLDQIWASAPQPGPTCGNFCSAEISGLRQHACASSHSVSTPRLVLTG